MSFSQNLNNNSLNLSNNLLNYLQSNNNLKPIYTINQPIFPNVPTHLPFPKVPINKPNFNLNPKIIIIDSTNYK